MTLDAGISPKRYVERLYVTREEWLDMSSKEQREIESLLRRYAEGALTIKVVHQKSTDLRIITTTLPVPCITYLGPVR